MLEFVIFGLGAIGVSVFAKRYQICVIRAAIALYQDDYEAADRQLRWATPPVLAWEKNSWAICLNMRIFVKTALGDLEWAQEQCERLLRTEGLALSVASLAHDRLAELTTPGPAYSGMWESGLPELRTLKLWESLAYFFWGIGDSARAAYCFREAPKTELLGQNLYLRFLCCADMGLPREELIIIAKEALDASTDRLQKATLLNILSRLYQQGEEYELAYRTAQESLQSCSDIELRRVALRLSMSQLRAMNRHQEASAAREAWCQTLTGEDLVPMVGLVHDEGDYEHCLDLLRPHLESEKPGINYALGTTLLELGHPGDAVSHLEKALGTNFIPSPEQNLVRAHWELLDRERLEHYLDQVPAREQAFAQSMRARLSYLWDGQSEEEPSLAGSLYRGDFEALSLRVEELLGELFSGVPRDFRLANMSYHRARVLAQSGDWENALSAFRVAESKFMGSPFQRARSGLQILECRAMLGEDVTEEFGQRATELREVYPTAKAFLGEISRIQIQIYLMTGRKSELVELVGDHLQNEPRKFERARSLKTRALAYRSLGRPELSESDCREIVTLVPGSFLAKWARRQIDRSASDG